ncbi:MAG: TolC family protein [Desulfamplus sp.]|nr:TolC family protein [Desulfamplus sp.]
MLYRIINTVIIFIFISSIAFPINDLFAQPSKKSSKKRDTKIAITKLLAIAKPAIDEDDYDSEPVDLELELQNSKSRLQNSQNSEPNFKDLTVLSENQEEASGNKYFHDIFKPIFAKHQRIKSAEAAVKAAKEQIRIRFGAYYPELELTLEAGREDEHGEIVPDQYNQSKLKLSQLLWDFGKTNAAVEKARRQLAEHELNLEKTRQKLIADAATAYQRLHKAYIVLQYSIQSEENIRRQTGLEEIRVAEGYGYTTDVLQSKSQLAGAMSRRQRNEGEYSLAESTYLEIFDKLPEDIAKMRPIDIYKMISIPNDLEIVLKVSLESNLDLLLAKNKESVVETDIRSEKNKALYPDIEFALEGDVSDNYSATFGNKKEYKASVILKKKINLGLIENNKIKAARETMVREKNLVIDREKLIGKTAKSAWQRLKTAEQITLTLTQQADLTAAFLKLAREERALGNRSLMDILAGETALINARSDSYAAKIDISFATFALLEVMGGLDLDMFDEY